jgi:hypothetical protein
MLTARRDETEQQLKERAMQLENGTHLHLHLSGYRTNDCTPPRHRSRDSQTSYSIGQLPDPGEGAVYQLETNADGTVEIMLVKQISEGEGELPNQTSDELISEGQEYRKRQGQQAGNYNNTSDRIHRLHATNGDDRLKAINQMNRDFWKRSTR